jgi:myo-inositol-1(or 4)-monophosphatase
VCPAADITVPYAARAIEAIRRVAREEIVPRFRNVVAEHKSDGSVVTEADHAAQHALERALTLLDPVPFLAEEMTGARQAAIWSAGGRLWCVDPLDGTRNFAAGIPSFAVSVALVEDGRSVFGTVYDPIADEAFYAVRGGGAWQDHKPLRVPSKGPALADAVAEVSLRREVSHLRGELKRHPPYRRRLTLGSAALAWCHLASARTDLMLHGGQRLWDYAAGALILEEAGGFASTFAHDDFWAAPPLTRSVVAARTGELQAAWRAWVRAQPRPGP